MSQNQRILEFLSDGEWHTMESIHAAVGFCRLNSRISELRSPKGGGHEIVCQREDGRDMRTRLPKQTYWYRLILPGLGSGDRAKLQQNLFGQAA